MRVKLLMLSIIVISAILRLYAINFGLPFTNIRHDEAYIINIAMGFGLGDFNPHHFNYPSLYLYLLFLLYVIYFVVGVIFGRFAGIYPFIREFTIDPSIFYLINRLLSFSFGIASVGLVYVLTVSSFNKRTALLATLFFGLAYLHIRESHFGKIDTAVTFFLILSLIFIVKIGHRGTWHDYILSGFFCGLSASVKYICGLLLLPLIFSCYQNNKIYKFVNKRIIMAFLASFIGFVVASPFIVLDFNTFIQDLSQLFSTLKQPWYGIRTEPGWLYHIIYSLLNGLGFGFLLAGIFGFIPLIKNKYNIAFVLLSFPISYYLLISKSQTNFARYGLPLIPFLSITAAYFVNGLYLWIKKRYDKRFSIISCVFISLFIVTPSMINSIQFDSLLAQKDSRLLAADWMNAHTTGGSIYQTGSWLGAVQLPLSKFSLNQKNESSDFKLFVTQERMKRLDQTNFNGYDQWTYDKTVKKFKYEGKFLTDIPQFIILYKTPLKIDAVTSPIDPYIENLISEFYQLMSKFEAMDLEQKNYLFEHQDAFYMPFAGFDGITRPGPNIYIYQKK